MSQSWGWKSEETNDPAQGAGGGSGVRPSAAGRFTMVLGAAAWRRAVSVVEERCISPEGMVVTLVPALWAAMTASQGASCIDACRILLYAYGQFGIRSELRAVELDVRKVHGEPVHHARKPSWEGNVLDGHCFLCLPDTDRFVDATVDAGAHPGFGVTMGEMRTWFGGGEYGVHIYRGVSQPVGAVMQIVGADLTLDYTFLDNAATEVIAGHPSLRKNVTAHRRAGINLASAALESLRIPRSIHRARASPYPRLHALLNAVGKAPVEVDGAGDWRFSVVGADGAVRRLRLDEILHRERPGRQSSADAALP